MIENFIHTKTLFIFIGLWLIYNFVSGNDNVIKKF